MTDEEAKACCASAYSSDVVAMLLGDAYHPGGLALTRHLAKQSAVDSGSRVLDVASGRGTTALTIAAERSARVTGVDLSAANVALAQGARENAELGDRVAFSRGDAERLDFADGSFDVVLCECALCTFPDKRTAVAEFARVLGPGGRVGITDVTAVTDRLPAELTGVAARIACIAGASGLDGYRELLESAGLRVVHTERHDAAMRRMLDQIEARLGLVRMTARGKAEALGVDFEAAPGVLRAARHALDDGAIGYCLITAEKPQ